MKTTKWIMPAILGLFLLAACDNSKSTQWYKTHQDELKQRYQECESSGEDSQECKNVREAHFELSQEKATVPDLN